jgi:ornithine carbamoyltransferase
MNPSHSIQATKTSKRDFLTLDDLTFHELVLLLNLAQKLKQERRDGVFPKRLENKKIALVFEKSSTRTRCAFVVAAVEEGMHAETLFAGDIHLGQKEDIQDTARVLSRFFDGILFRGYAHATVQSLAENSSVPVWNGLTDDHHPTQALADALTLAEHLGGVEHLAGKKWVYFGDAANNTARSLIELSAKLGMEMVLCCPEGYLPAAEVLSKARKECVLSGGKLNWEPDPQRAALGAHALYTDVWISMGEEEKPYAKQKRENLQAWQINASTLKSTGRKDAIFLHCLPALKGWEVTEEVFEGPHSVVFEQAENRLHTIKALMLWSLSAQSLI